MRRAVLSTFRFAAILGLDCMGVAVLGKAYGHCEDILCSASAINFNSYNFDFMPVYSSKT